MWERLRRYLRDFRWPKIFRLKLEGGRPAEISNQLENNLPNQNVFYTSGNGVDQIRPNTITLKEILQLGKLKSSLQVNYLADFKWLRKQYKEAGYGNKKLTIVVDKENLKENQVRQKDTNVDVHHVHITDNKRAAKYKSHNTKLMVLCYEDDSVRIVVSTADLKKHEWECKTQSLWISPICPRTTDKDSTTGFKASLLEYLDEYDQTIKENLTPYIECIKNCDFSKINVFLVASVPQKLTKSPKWGLKRVEDLLKNHCNIPPEEQCAWDFICQTSSIGAVGRKENWLIGDLQNAFCKTVAGSTDQPKLKLIYPSVENQEDALGNATCKFPIEFWRIQKWLYNNSYLYQWTATENNRNKLIPHINSYLRVSPDGKRVAYYLLTSSNIDIWVWGRSHIRHPEEMDIDNFEMGVLFLPEVVVQKDFFNREDLLIPYDLPPLKYTPGMTPFTT